MKFVRVIDLKQQISESMSTYMLQLRTEQMSATSIKDDNVGPHLQLKLLIFVKTLTSSYLHCAVLSLLESHGGMLLDELDTGRNQRAQHTSSGKSVSVSSFITVQTKDIIFFITSFTEL